MNFPLTNREIKDRARGELPGHYRTIICAELLSVMIIIAATSLFGDSPRLIALAGTFIVNLLLLIMQSGFSYIYLTIARGDMVRVTDLFYFFRHHSDTMILLIVLLEAINTAIILPFWVLENIAASKLTGNAAFGLILLIVAAYLIVMASINLRYLYSFFICIDHPELNALSILKKSRLKMQGQLLRILMLLLSFVGYFLLAILSLGIGLLWVMPYVQMSLTEAYLET